MRLFQIMTLVFVMLFLAMIPAFLHFARVTGVPRSASLAVFAGVLVIAALKRD